jgi:hypothetical protein
MRLTGEGSLPVVPAKAGTHNHGEEFGEDTSFGTPTLFDR